MYMNVYFAYQTATVFENFIYIICIPTNFGCDERFFAVSYIILLFYFILFLPKSLSTINSLCVVPVHKLDRFRFKVNIYAGRMTNMNGGSFS